MQILRSTVAVGLAIGLALFGVQAAHAQDTTTTESSSSVAASSESAVSAVSEAATSESSAAPVAAPAIAQLNAVPPPPEGKGQVIFFRPSRMAGMALSFSVHEGNTGIGKLNNGTYFVHITDPGDKAYTISSEATDTLRLEVEEGETYYVIQAIGMGVFVGRPNLTPSTEAAFQAKKLKVSTAKPTDRN